MIMTVFISIVGGVIYYIQYNANKDTEQNERISKLEGQMEILLQDRSYEKSKGIK